MVARGRDRQLYFDEIDCASKMFLLRTRRMRAMNLRNEYAALRAHTLEQRKIYSNFGINESDEDDGKEMRTAIGAKRRCRA